MFIILAKGLVGMGGNSRLRGREFKSQHQILDGHFSHQVCSCLKSTKNKRKRDQKCPLKNSQPKHSMCHNLVLKRSTQTCQVHSKRCPKCIFMGRCDEAVVVTLFPVWILEMHGSGPVVGYNVISIIDEIPTKVYRSRFLCQITTYQHLYLVTLLTVRSHAVIEICQLQNYRQGSDQN